MGVSFHLRIFLSRIEGVQIFASIIASGITFFFISEKELRRSNVSLEQIVINIWALREKNENSMDELLWFERFLKLKISNFFRKFDKRKFEEF